MRNHNDNLGTGTVTINDGAGLDIYNRTISNSLIINGAYTSSYGNLFSSNTGTYTGTILMNAAASIGGNGTLTISGVIDDGGNNYTLTKIGTGTVILSGTNTYTGDTNVVNGTLRLIGALSESTDLIVAAGKTFDLQVSQTVASLDLDGTITNAAGTSSLTVLGTADIEGSITTTGTQDYEGPVTLTGDTTLTTSSAQITFDDTVNSESGETNDLTVTASVLQFDDVVGGLRTLGDIDITAGTLNLNGTITAATSLIVSDIYNLNADVVTEGAQTYYGDVVISNNISMTSNNSDIIFYGTVDSANSTRRNLTINLNNAGADSITAEVIFGSESTHTIGETNPLGVIIITGNLDLNAAVVDATSISVSGTSNLGADVTTTSTQTYTGAVVLGADITLTGTIINTQSTIGSVLNISAQGLNGWTNNAGTSLSSPTIFYNDGTNGREEILAGFNDIVKYSEVTGLGGQSVTVTFNWYKIDSWDNEEDLKIIVNGTQIFSSTFTNSTTNKSQTSSGYTTTFVNRKSNGNYGSYASYGNSNSGWYDSSFLVTITTPAINSFELKIDADNMQAASDESYGVRDFALSGGTSSKALTINGNLNADGAISGLSTLSVTGTSSLNGNVTSSSTQEYTGNVSISNDITLTTTDSNITFSSTVDGDGTARDLTIDMDNSGDGADGTVQFANTVGANNSLDVIDITGNLNLDAAISNTTSLSVSGTSNLGADVTTSSTQTYSGAVVLSNDVTLTTTDSDIIFSSTIDSDSTARDLTLTLGSGSASVTGIVGTTALDVLTLNSSASFTAAVTATSIVNAANKTATFSDNLTAAVTNSGGLLFNHTGSGATVDITYTAGGADIIRVEDSQDNVSPAVVTFANAITATALRVGALDGSKAGAALFEEAVTIPTITVIGGNHTDEDSTVTFNKAVTSSSGITLDDNTGDAKIIFAENNSVTIAGTIDGASANEGTLQITGTLKTFSGAVGNTYRINVLDIDNAVSFASSVATTTATIDGAINTAASINVSSTSAINADVTTTGTQTYTGAVTLNADVILTTTDNNISFGSTINSFDTTYRDLSLVTGSGSVSVTGIIGADDKLDVLTVNNTGTLTLSAATTVNTLTLTHTGGTTIGGTLTATTINLTDTTDAADITFNGNVSATTLNTAAEGYNVIFNGTTSTITNLVTFSNSGSVTFGNGTGDTTTFTGGVTATAPSQVNLAGTIQTTNNTMSLGDAGTPIVLTANTILSGNTAGAITLGGTVNGAYSLTVNTTGDTTFTLAVGNTTALTTLTTNASGTTYINGGAITTSSTQTYNDAVVLGADTTLTTTDSNITFSSTIDSDSGDSKRDLTLTLGSGSASITGIVGTTSLADITLNSSATFNAAITATNLTIAANKTATVKDDVTIASNITLNNNSTLAVINTAAITIAGTILENGGSASNTSITVKFNTANTVSEKVTFSGAVTTDAIYVGDTAAATYAGYAHFTGSGGVTVTDATVTSGNHANEYSIMKFDYAVTASNEITINDKNETAYQAYLIFSGDNTVTIAGNIVTADDEGTLQVTGTGKTFTGSIGSSTYQLELINIDVATTFNGAVYTTDLEVDGAITSTNSLFVSEISTINADVTTTGTQTYTGAVTLNADVILTTTDNNISFGSTINSFDTTYRDLSLVTGSGNVSVTGIIGADDKLDVLTVNNTGTLTLSAATTVNTLTLTHTGGTTIGGTLTATTINLTDTTDAADITFNGNVSATTLNTAAEGYNVIFNGTTSTITNLVTFSNSGSVTFGNGTGDTTTFTGGVTATAPSQVNLAGTIQTTNNTMSLGDAGTPIVLTANTILSGNTAGAITLGGTVNGAYSLTVNTTGDTTFTLAVGNTTALTTLTTNASGTTYINGGAITTSSTQTYNDAVVLGADTTLTTTDSNITFSSTVDGDGTARDLTIDMDNGVGADGTVQFINTIGANDDLDVIDITGNLNLDAAISNTTSLSYLLLLILVQM